MSLSSRNRFVLASAAAAMLATSAMLGASETPSEPTNSQPNPYKTVKGWYQLPAGRTMGSSSAVDVDSKGHIWIADRCEKNSCDGSNLDPIFEFDASGKLLKSFGGGMFIFPHGICIDKD